jgi:hypothetical protein
MNKDEVWVAALFYGQVSSTLVHVRVSVEYTSRSRPRRAKKNCVPSKLSCNSSANVCRQILDAAGTPTEASVRSRQLIQSYIGCLR